MEKIEADFRTEFSAELPVDASCTRPPIPEELRKRYVQISNDIGDVLKELLLLAYEKRAQPSLVPPDMFLHKSYQTMYWLRVAALGDDNPDTLEIQYATLAFQDRPTDASFREHLELRKRVLGPRHPGTLQSLATFVRSMKCRGRVYVACSCWDRKWTAEDTAMLSEMLLGFEELYNKDHPITQDAYHFADSVVKDWPKPLLEQQVEVTDRVKELMREPRPSVPFSRHCVWAAPCLARREDP